MIDGANSLKLYFLIAPALYLVNSIIAISFSVKYKNDPIYRKSAFIWVFYLILGVSQGALENADVMTKTLAWSAAAFFVIFCMSRFISDLFDVKYKIKLDFTFFIIGMLLSIVLFMYTSNSFLAALPSTVVAALPVLRLSYLMKNFNKYSFTKVGTLLCAIVISLHVIDYAYAVDKSHLQFPGYLLALMLATALSCFIFAALVERVITHYEMKDLLQTTSRLTALGGMAAEISHEIKNPLTVLAINNHQMKLKLKNDELNKVYFVQKIDVAEKMLNRLNKIMESLKAHYNSGIVDDYKEAYVRDLFEETKTLCEFRSNKKNIKTTFTEETQGLKLECRSVQIIQVLQNLVQNSIDELDGIDSPEIKVSARQFNENQIQFTISDNGYGVPDDIRPHIFDPFFTTKSDGKGTGLGLSVSRRFVNEHKGELYLSDKKTTEFVIILPVNQ